MATNDYSGEVLTMESFTAQTTDASGDIVINLQNTPCADDSMVFQLSGVEGAFCQFQSRSDKAVTVRVYQKYDKIDSGYSVTDLPASVSADTTVGGPTFTSSTHSTTVATDGGARLAVGSHNHTTTISKISDHSHTITATALTALASTGGITITVLYAF